MKIAIIGSRYVKDVKKARVLVVGDVMLDRYWYGDVSRISPEAPVPVVRIRHSEERLGGAANVARNAAALGARVTLLSVVGQDDAARRLVALLRSERIVAHLRRDPAISTTLKLRVVGPGLHQMLRVDFEGEPSRELLRAKLDDYARLVGNCDAVVLSDYGKGGLAHIPRMIRLARQQHKPVLVDPKGNDFSRYRGATLLTPNLGEFRAIVGDWKSEREFTRLAHELRRRLDVQSLLVTRGGDGMTLFERQTRLHVAAQAREVSDVTGAGDTVIATLAAMLAAGSTLEAAVRTANRAGGIVVSKFGTAVVRPEELFEETGPGAGGEKTGARGQGPGARGAGPNLPQRKSATSTNSSNHTRNHGKAR